MSVVQKFNGLIGCGVSRREIERIIIEAQRQEQPVLVKRLQTVLDNNPKEKDFKFTKKSVPAIEIVPDSFISCLDCEQDADDKIIGLGKAVSPNEIYQMITDRMIEKIKHANTKDYKKKWQGQWYGKGYLIPFNFVTKKMYRGVNRFLLTDFEPLENPFYLTFKQVEELKGKVKKGAHGRIVVYFTQLFRYQSADEKLDIASYDRKKFIQQLKANSDKIRMIKEGMSPEAIAAQSALPILKYYKVFNGKDIEGIDFDLANFKLGFIENKIPADDEHKMPVAEAIIKNYPSPQPKQTYGGDRAFYSLSSDSVKMPYIFDFDTAQDYYCTYFHELVHSTGHEKRLDRNLKSRSKKDYAFEELIAEFGATFVSAEAGILWHTDKNFPAYLKSWNSALTHLKDDNRFLMRAATQAQKAADFILQYDADGQPKYFADIAEKPKKKTARKKTAKAKLKPEKPEAVKPVATPAKPKATKQLSLFDAGLNGKRKTLKKETGLNAIAPEPVSLIPEGIEPVNVCKPISSNPRVMKINAAANDAPSEFYTVAGEVGKFLQAVERKPVESVVITMDGEQGAGKTTTLYKFMDAFALPGNKCLFLSLEEHPTSSLAKEKTDKYLSPEAQANIDVVGDVTDTADLYDLVKDYEIIFIDSWQKLQRMVGAIRLDEDLRKKFDGKVFVIIFQQTTTGRTKGGSEVVFDGDIIIKMVKEASFADNYAYFDKNRYTKVPIETIQYNIASGTCYNPLGEPEAEQPQQTVATALNFEVV